MGCQSGPFIAAFFFVDLDDDLLAFLDDLGDVDSAFDLVQGNLEVLAGYFFKRQKAMTIAAVIDKGGFETGLNAGDFGLIDIGLFLFPDAIFDVQVVEFLPIYQGDTQLLFVSCID